MADRAHIELCRRDPAYFRENLIIDGASRAPVRFGDVMADFQKKDFESLDPCLRWLADVTYPKDGKEIRFPAPKVRRHFIQRGRGSSKTSDLATCVLYLIAFAPKPLDCIVAAEDRDQATLILKQADKIIANNPWLGDFVEVQRSKLRNNRTGAILTCMPRDRFSSYGITPDVTIVDEFTHITQEGFWESILSSYGKKEGLLIVACNAGVGSDWKWRAKVHAEQSPLWYHSAPEGAAPWYTEEMLAEQRALLSKTEFSRLWENKWQDSLGEFVSLKEADACIDENLKEQKGTIQDGYTYVASLDYAEKHDRTVGCVTHLFNGTIYVDRMDVVVPEKTPQGIVPLSWCEEWIYEVQDKFGGQHGTVYFVLDRHQLLYLIQQLPLRGFNLHEFEFKGGIGNWEMCLLLKNLILERRVRWYPGCGALDVPGVRDDLSTELAGLIVKQSGVRWRFDHTPSGYDDRAYALGSNCLFWMRNVVSEEPFESQLKRMR